MGMPLEYIIVIKIEVITWAYLTSIRNSGPEYTSLYSSYKSFFVFLLLQVQPLSIHLLNDLIKILIKAPIWGATTFIIIVKHIVVPTTLYHSTVKSWNSPASSGKKSGRVTSVTFALTSKMTRPVFMNWIKNILIVLEAFSSVFVWNF